MSIRIWFLIQQFVMRHNLHEYNHIAFFDYLHCRTCRTRVAIIQDYIPTANDLVIQGFFNRLFNVEVAEDERYHQVIDGMTLAKTYCVQCRNLLGWKFIAVSQPSRRHRVGGFYMRLNQIICWNNVPLLELLLGGNNEQAPNDQDGGADEEQDDDQNGGANELNADHDGDANEQVTNEQNADQDGDANEQVTNEKNADQDGDANEQDLVENEQNADQDEDANEQDLGANEQNANLNADQDGDANEQVPNEYNAGQDRDTNERNADQDGDDNEQDLGANEENADQDGGINEQVPNKDVDIAEGMDNIDLNANI